MRSAEKDFYVGKTEANGKEVCHFVTLFSHTMLFDDELAKRKHCVEEECDAVALQVGAVLK